MTKRDSKHQKKVDMKKNESYPVPVRAPGMFKKPSDSSTTSFPEIVVDLDFTRT
jgi:hypothetical protein